MRVDRTSLTCDSSSLLYYMNEVCNSTPYSNHRTFEFYVKNCIWLVKINNSINSKTCCKYNTTLYKIEYSTSHSRRYHNFILAYIVLAI